MSSKNKTRNKIKNNKNESKKVISNNTKENIYIAIGLIIFTIIVILCIYFVLRANNPDAFEKEDEILIKNKNSEEGHITNNSFTNSTNQAKNIIENGTFALLAENIYIKGNVPKTIASKFHIECYEDGTIEIYSRYTYNLSEAKNLDIKGLILKIMIVKDDILKLVESEEGNYEIIKKIDEYNIIYIVPENIEYIEDDDISRSNYDRLSKYRKEIIESITVTKEDLDIENTIE